MNGDEMPQRDIEALLDEAGARWRSRQVFQPVVLSPESIAHHERRRSTIAMIASGIGTLAVGAALVAVLALALQVQRTPGGGQTGSTAPATPPAAAAMPSSSGESPRAPDSATPPIDVEASRLAAIEAVNSDTLNFGGVYIDDDDVLVIQYVGANAGGEAVEARLSPGVAVRWEKVERSRSELMRTLREIRDRALPGVVMIAIDTINNVVEVTVDFIEYDDVSDVLTKEYGDSVAVTSGPPIVVQPAYPSPRSK
jgi:hypothetical protein